MVFFEHRYRNNLAMDVVGDRMARERNIDLQEDLMYKVRMAFSPCLVRLGDIVTDKFFFFKKMGFPRESTPSLDVVFLASMTSTIRGFLIYRALRKRQHPY